MLKLFGYLYHDMLLCLFVIGSTPFIHGTFVIDFEMLSIVLDIGLSPCWK